MGKTELDADPVAAYTPGGIHALVPGDGTRIPSELLEGGEARWMPVHPIDMSGDGVRYA